MQFSAVSVAGRGEAWGRSRSLGLVCALPSTPPYLSLYEFEPICMQLMMTWQIRRRTIDMQ